MGFFEREREIREQAEKLAPRVTLTEREHHREGYKRFQVHLGETSLGFVEHGDETLERRPKGAVYVTRRWTRKRWVEDPDSRYRIPWAGRLYYGSRKAAIQALLETLLRHEKLAV